MRTDVDRSQATHRNRMRLVWALSDTLSSLASAAEFAQILGDDDTLAEVRKAQAIVNEVAR